MILTLINEHGQHVSLFQDTLGVLTDPAHIIAEIVISIAFEILQFVVIYYFWKKILKPRFFAQVHAEVDAEHGIEHHEDHVHENVHVPIGGCVPLDEPPERKYIATEQITISTSGGSKTLSPGDTVTFNGPQSQSEPPMGCQPYLNTNRAFPRLK